MQVGDGQRMGLLDDVFPESADPQRIRFENQAWIDLPTGYVLHDVNAVVSRFCGLSRTPPRLGVPRGGNDQTFGAIGTGRECDQAAANCGQAVDHG
jgi:hypothetical protein